LPRGKAAGRSASELRCSLETQDEAADPVVRRGRPVLAKLTRRTDAREGFRGSRGGMWRKIRVVVLETRGGAAGGRTQPGRIRQRSRFGPARESEGLMVPLRGGNHARREGALLCSRNRSRGRWGHCREAKNP
jgi:hypothetical protein